MKIAAIILAIVFASCTTASRLHQGTLPDRQEQAKLVSVIKQKHGRYMLKLETVKGNTVFYGVRGAGIGKPHHIPGTKYTVHFRKDKVISITKNN